MTTINLDALRLTIDPETGLPVSGGEVTITVTYAGDLETLSYSVDGLGMATFTPLADNETFSDGAHLLPLDIAVIDISWSTDDGFGVTTVVSYGYAPGNTLWFVPIAGDAPGFTDFTGLQAVNFLIAGSALVPGPLGPGQNVLLALDDPDFANVTITQDDTLIFDAGFNEIIGGTGRDVIDGGAGFDLIDYSGLAVGIDAHLGLGLVRKGIAGRDTITNVEDIRGTDVADRIVGEDSTGGNFFFGLDGTDIIRGRGGDDQIFGGNDADKLFGDAGEDRIEGGDGEDRIEGGDDNDTLLGDGARDVMRGQGGDDTMFGGTGNDRMLGGIGSDYMRGQQDDDDLYGQGDDDLLWGDGGIDRLDGGRGADRLNGGTENDFLFGGAGADVFVFEDIEDMGRDRIKDWQDGIDRIDVIDYGFLSFAALAAVATDTASGLRIDFGADSTGDARIVWIENMLKADFDAGDVDFLQVI